MYLLVTRNGSYGQVLAHLARTYVVCTYRPCARKLSLLVRLSTAVGPCMFFVWTRSIWRFNAQRTSNKNYNQPRIQTIIHTQRKRQQEKAVISQPRQSACFFSSIFLLRTWYIFSVCYCPSRYFLRLVHGTYTL